jgi:hypothetical protein
MNIGVLGTLFAVSAVINGDSTAISGSAMPSRSLGSCVGADGAVNISMVLFIENNSLEWNHSSEPVRVTIRRQSIDIKSLRLSDGITYPYNISRMVSLDGNYADIILKLGLLNSSPVVYWRETFQHRMYRQGILSVVGHRLTPLCNGLGGETIFD